MNLIYDRTPVDVSHVEALTQKGWEKMTLAEKTEWLAGLKGAYNYTDWNRVGEAMAYLKALYASFGYSVAAFPVTDWAKGDIPTADECDSCLASLSAIRDKIKMPPGTPQVPPDMEGLEYWEANDIEKILEVVDVLLKKTFATYHHSGTFAAGQGGLFR